MSKFKLTDNYIALAIIVGGFAFGGGVLAITGGNEATAERVFGLITTCVTASAALARAHDPNAEGDEVLDTPNVYNTHQQQPETPVFSQPVQNDWRADLNVQDEYEEGYPEYPGKDDEFPS